jgi:chromosome partitioning protein
MNSKVISILNQKGGVGKTTTAVNLATGFSVIDKKTLLIDLDPQGNASSSLGIDQAGRKLTIYDVLVDNVDINQAVLETQIAGLELVPSNVNLLAAEIELVGFQDRELILKKHIAKILDRYHYIIIDCPPALGLLSMNSLVAADEILIPIQCEFLALEGLSHLLQTIEIVKGNFNKSLKILGILLTMYDKRNRLTEVVEQDVRSCLKDLVFQTTIPRNIKLSEAPSYGKPAIIYDHKCAGSISYMHLVREILANEILANETQSKTTSNKHTANLYNSHE